MNKILAFFVVLILAACAPKDGREQLLERVPAGAESVVLIDGRAFLASAGITLADDGSGIQLYSPAADELNSRLSDMSANLSYVGLFDFGQQVFVARVNDPAKAEAFLRREYSRYEERNGVKLFYSQGRYGVDYRECTAIYDNFLYHSSGFFDAPQVICNAIEAAEKESFDGNDMTEDENGLSYAGTNIGELQDRIRELLSVLAR